MEYAFGKVPDKLDTGDFRQKTTLILHYGHEKPDQETPAHDKENPDQSTVIGLSWKQQAACLNAKQVVKQQSDDNSGSAY